MKIPVILNERLIDKDGKMTESWRTLFHQLLSQMQKGLSDEGVIMPQQSATNISAITGEKSIGGVLYDSTNNQFKANINQVWKHIPMANGLVANKAVVTNADGDITSSITSDIELNYLNGITSSVQSQINGKEPTITTGTSGQYWRGDKSWETLDTSVIPENTNLYFTNERATASISSTATGLAYEPLTGVISLSSGYAIPDATTLVTSWTMPISFSGGVVSISQANTTTDGYLVHGDWNTFNNSSTAVSNATSLDTINTLVSRDGMGAAALIINDNYVTPRKCLDNDARLLIDTSGQTAGDWQNRNLCDTTGATVINFANILDIKTEMNLAPLSSAPASPIDGTMYVGGTLGSRHLYIYLNGSWQTII